MKIAIISDSNAGISQEEAKEMGMFVQPSPFYINDKLELAGVTMTEEQFYTALQDDNIDVKTSMPTLGDMTDTWDELLKTHDEVVFIPISSGLSSTYSTAAMLAEDYDGRVQVVDNRRVSVTQYCSIVDALELAKMGKNAKEIKEYLEKTADRSSIYLSLDTLKYLKKGGRITPAAAAIGTLLNLKPVLQIQGDKLDAYAKCRGKAQAKKTMLDAIRKDMEGRFKDAATKHNLNLLIAYGAYLDDALEWREEVKEAFPDYEVVMQPLSLSVACHIGPGVLAVALAEGLDTSLL